MGHITTLLIIGLYLTLFPTNDCAVLDVYVVKDIKNFESCPLVKGPTLNITHTKDYQSLTVC